MLRVEQGFSPAFRLYGKESVSAAEVRGELCQTAKPQLSKNSRICGQYFRTTMSVLRCPPGSSRRQEFRNNLAFESCPEHSVSQSLALVCVALRRLTRILTSAICILTSAINTPPGPSPKPNSPNTPSSPAPPNPPPAISPATGDIQPATSGAPAGQSLLTPPAKYEMS